MLTIGLTLIFPRTEISSKTSGNNQNLADENKTFPAAVSLSLILDYHGGERKPSSNMKFILLLPLIWWQSIFKEKQLEYGRVRNAYAEKEATAKSYFDLNGVPYSDFEIFLRAFKKERTLEVWVRTRGAGTFKQLTSYSFCTSSGTLGPKRREGDGQIPEGIYYINHFNPQSNFHLSLGINYPNQSDKILGDPSRPGGSIYIHGNCVTIGCIPITDDKIKELYVIAVEARQWRQLKIPVHIFPARLTNENTIQELSTTYNSPSGTITLWRNLQSIYQDFESTRSLKPIRVNQNGAYTF